MMEKQLAQKTETIFYYEFHWEITPIPLGLWILAQFLAPPRTALNEIRRGEREAFTMASQGKYMQHQHSTFCMTKSFVLLDMMTFSRFSHHVGSNYLTPADGRFLLSPNPHSTPLPMFLLQPQFNSFDVSHCSVSYTTLMPSALWL